MGGRESSLKDQAWCSNNNMNCRNWFTEVENVNTEAKRTSPMPKTELQQLLKDQKQMGKLNHNVQTTQQSTLPGTGNYKNDIFASDEQRLDFKSALKQQNRIDRLSMLVGKAPRLELKVLSSAFLEKGEVLYLNPLGLEENRSLRKVSDGFTYFGCKKAIRKTPKVINSQNQIKVYKKQSQIIDNNSNLKNTDNFSAQMGATGASLDEMNDSKNVSYDKEIVNDFVIPTKNEEEKEKHRGRQFQIYFDPDSFNYKIKDLGVGYGAFVKLTRPIVLRDNFLLNMGESYIVANLFKSQDDMIGIVGVNKVPMKLRLKIFSVVKADQPDVFSCQNEQQEIIIGRTPNCDIRIEDKLLSKAQATIRFDGDNWVLQDGFEGRESTNGTWLYLNEDCDIENGMVFKSNQTFFEATILQQDS
ncbi:UNKNOWN [Stylonychia lemnae]|uniref:FHA domain-containing protein n=1 Tax=Stylonychia lemnae TaxID=5949 RepID=A0A078A290_STYLE|nr:UNKNOWN [Stylonychia lemnae]|eukprot:CDW75623.1 UNKNOWN [Stylonychia lemnae]